MSLFIVSFWFIIVRKDIKSIMMGQMILISACMFTLEYFEFDRKSIDEYLVYLIVVSFLFNTVTMLYFWKTGKFNIEE
jgi:hypothetical protein